MSMSFSTPCLDLLYANSIAFSAPTIGAVINAPAGLNTSSSATFVNSDALNFTGLSVLSCVLASCCISSNFFSTGFLIRVIVSDAAIAFISFCTDSTSPPNAFRTRNNSSKTVKPPSLFLGMA